MSRVLLTLYARTVRSTHAAAASTDRATTMSMGMAFLLSLKMKPRSDLDARELDCRLVGPMCSDGRLRLAKAAPQGPDDAGGRRTLVSA